jgi:ligand-binding SRPBCC domain-containing protein
MIAIEDITIIRAPIERCFDLTRSVEVHLTGNVHWGEAAIAAGEVASGLLSRGDRVTWRARHFGVRWTLISEITSMNRPVYFQDAMLRGPFRFMRHDHFFQALSAGETRMRDVLELAAPLPIVGRLAEVALLRRYMQRLLRERVAVIREIAQSEKWRRYLA